MILLKTLTIKNFISHENTEIAFSENEKLVLDGRSGSGKSSIAESIIWCLYGRGRSENRSLVRRGCRTASVSLQLTDEQLKYNITRTVSSTGKNALMVTRSTDGGSFSAIETTGLKDTQNWIESTLLKASFELFTNSIAYPQGSENSFVKATATERKDLLLEIIHAGNFDELYIKARDAITKVETIIAINLSQKEGCEKIITNNELSASTLVKLSEELTDITGQINIKTKEQKELEDIVKNAEFVSEQIKNKKQMILQYDTVLEGIDNRIDYKTKIIKENESIDIEEARKKVDIIEKVNLEIEKEEKYIRENTERQYKINAHLANKPTVYDYTKDIERINKQLIPLIKDSGSCPAGEDCPFIVPIKGQIQFLEEQIQDKEQKTSDGQASMTLWVNQYELFLQPTDTTKLYENIETLKKEVKILLPFKDVVTRYEIGLKTNETLRVEIEEDKKDRVKTIIEYNDLTRQVVELEKINVDVIEECKKLYDINEVIDILEKKREVGIRNHALAQQAQKTVLEARQSLQELDSQTKSLKAQYDDLLLIKEALGPRGVKAVAVDYVIPVLEERINEVLSQMSDFRIRLDTQKPTADEEGVKEGLFIIVKNPEGEELPLSNLSGGETVKVSMAISEALATLMSSVGFRILDECVNALDNESTQAFVEVILKLQDKFPQLLMISHIQDIKDLFEKRIMITKINGVSKIT